MIEKPRVSVVMSVVDKPIHVLATIRSVLQQVKVDFELIVILDGASPLVEQMLRVYARNPQVRLVKQDRRGLTRALIHGCRLASYELIARIDAGDTMVADRLFRQAQVMLENADVGLVASEVEVRTDEGYFLRNIAADRKELIRGMAARDVAQFIAPVHSAIMFRKAVYEQVGGYRKAFCYSQDADLWTRITERSQLVVLPKILTTVICSPDSISGRRTDCQRQFLKIVIDATAARAAGESDKPFLQQANKLKCNDDNLFDNQWQCMKKIALCLNQHSSRYAREYWWRVVRTKPLKVLNWLPLLKSLLMRQ